MTPIQDVDAGPAKEVVDTAIPPKNVVAGAAEQPIVAQSARQDVVAWAADDQVVAGASGESGEGREAHHLGGEDVVVTGAEAIDVVSGAVEHQIRSRGPGQGVVPLPQRGARDGETGSRPDQDVPNVIAQVAHRDLGSVEAGCVVAGRGERAGLRAPA